MSLIDNEIFGSDMEKLKKIVVEDKTFEFPQIRKRDQTYYINYDSSKHLDKILTEYRSETIADIRINLMNLWKDESSREGVISVILSSCMKSNKRPAVQTGEVDLYNYMM